jgi:hypothetical protein
VRLCRMAGPDPGYASLHPGYENGRPDKGL